MLLNLGYVPREPEVIPPDYNVTDDPLFWDFNFRNVRSAFYFAAKSLTCDDSGPVRQCHAAHVVLWQQVPASRSRFVCTCAMLSPKRLHDSFFILERDISSYEVGGLSKSYKPWPCRRNIFTRRDCDMLSGKIWKSMCDIQYFLSWCRNVWNGSRSAHSTNDCY